jgi:putative transposase
MPRIARIIAPHFPHHVTQRGNNRAAVFFDDEVRQTYLHLLDKYSKKFFLQIWAYCLMDNHIHILAVPEKEDSLSRGVGLTNQVYTQYLNRKLSQSGRIWQNRFYSCLVDNDAYLWTVARYIELNPVVTGIIDKAEDYRWSSAKAHLTGGTNSLFHSPSWLESKQRESYCEFMLHSDNEVNKAIRKATRTGRPFGSEEFIDNMELRLNQTLRPRKPGRPKKECGEWP